MSVEGYIPIYGPLHKFRNIFVAYDFLPKKNDLSVKETYTRFCIRIEIKALEGFLSSIRSDSLPRDAQPLSEKLHPAPDAQTNSPHRVKGNPCHKKMMPCSWPFLRQRLHYAWASGRSGICSTLATCPLSKLADRAEFMSMKLNGSPAVVLGHIDQTPNEALAQAVLCWESRHLGYSERAPHTDSASAGSPANKS
jgi:hypothetical protein